jgi:hypothetical protein
MPLPRTNIVFNRGAQKLATFAAGPNKEKVGGRCEIKDLLRRYQFQTASTGIYELSRNLNLSTAIPIKCVNLFLKPS